MRKAERRGWNYWLNLHFEKGVGHLVRTQAGEETCESFINTSWKPLASKLDKNNKPKYCITWELPQCLPFLRLP